MSDRFDSETSTSIFPSPSISSTATSRPTDRPSPHTSSRYADVTTANTIAVNGATCPIWHARRMRYRLCMLNASNARTYVLKLVTNPLAARLASAALPIWQIGADGGVLPAPAKLDQVIVAPGERADLIVDFTVLPVGTALDLINEGPDEPYHGGVPSTDFDAADPYTTGQVMKIVVGAAPKRPDASVPPGHLRLPGIKPLGAPSQKFVVSLNEIDSTTYDEAPIFGTLGTVKIPTAAASRGCGTTRSTSGRAQARWGSGTW